MPDPVSVDLSPKCQPRCRSTMSVEYVGRVCRCSMSVDMSADTRLTLDQHYRPHLGRHSADITVEYRPTLSADISGDTRPIPRPILDRRLGRLSGKISTDSLSNVIVSIVSVDNWPTVSVDSPPTPTPTTVSGHYTTTLHYATTIGRHSTDSVGRYSTDTLGRHLGRDVCRYLRRYSTDTRPTVSTDNRSTLDWHSTDTHPTLGRHSADTRPTSRPILNRHFGRHSTDSVGRDFGPYLGRYSADTRPTLDWSSTNTLGGNWADISANTQPTFWPTLRRHSTDSVRRHLTDSEWASRLFITTGHWHGLQTKNGSCPKY